MAAFAPGDRKVASVSKTSFDWDHNDRNDKFLLDDVDSPGGGWMESSGAEIDPSRELTAFVRASRQLSDAKLRQH